MSDLKPPAVNVTPNSLRMHPGVGPDGLSLVVNNPSPNQTLLYKCKTTSPSRYIVRNRQGVIAPSSSQTVLISLQRGVVIQGDEEPDVFLIESRYLKSEEVGGVSRDSDFTELMKRHGKTAITKKQIRCELSLTASGKGGRGDNASSTTQPTPVKKTGGSAGGSGGKKGGGAFMYIAILVALIAIAAAVFLAMNPELLGGSKGGKKAGKAAAKKGGAAKAGGGKGAAGKKAPPPPEPEEDEEEEGEEEGDDEGEEEE